MDGILGDKYGRLLFFVLLQPLHHTCVKRHHH